MERSDLKKIVKKCIKLYLFLGMVIGSIMLIYSVNNYFPWSMIGKQYHGITAGLLAFIQMPIIMSIVGLIHALLLWYPIIILYKKIVRKKQ